MGLKVDCPTWLLNVVPTNKVGGDHGICVDFIDVNTTTIMDGLPLPNIDQLVDATTGFEVMSFMDAYSSYYHIQMQ